MKLLFSSPDLDEVGPLVKRLLWACIPCAVCKNADSADFGIWIQQDIDFPSALHVYANRETTRSLPHWAAVLEPEAIVGFRPAEVDEGIVETSHRPPYKRIEASCAKPPARIPCPPAREAPRTFAVAQLWLRQSMDLPVT